MKSDQTEHNINNNSDDDNECIDDDDDNVKNSFFTFRKKVPYHFLHISKHAFMHTAYQLPAYTRRQQSNPHLSCILMKQRGCIVSQ